MNMKPRFLRDRRSMDKKILSNSKGQSQAFKSKKCYRCAQWPFLHFQGNMKNRKTFWSVQTYFRK